MDSDQVARILDRANDLLEAGKPGETLRCLAQIEHAALDEDDRIEAASLRAWALSEMGRHDVALRHIEPLLEQYPDSARLHAARGIVLSNADDLEEARQSLETAFALEPNDEVTLANLALVYEKLRSYEQALELFDQALEMGADIDWTLQRKGAVQTELGDYAGAKQTLKRYLSLVPEDAGQWISLGILHSDDEEYEEAFNCYREAARCDPDSPWLHLNWGVTAVRAGDLDTAIIELDALRKCAGDTTRPALLEAFVLEEQQEIEQAEALYQRAIDALDPADQENTTYVLEMAMDFYSRRRRVDKCTELLAKAYEANCCTVELCEAYREVTGQHLDEGTWFSLVVEADYRAGLDEVPDHGDKSGATPTRFLRNYQIVARDRDEATALTLDFAAEMGEKHARVREFINDEPVDDTYAGIYEVERKVLVFAE